MKASRLQLTGATLALAAATAVAAGPAAATHTVTWFADNPQERARVELRCIDDPGHLGTTPDCINARQAASELSYRYLQRSNAPRYTPSDPRYWSARPVVRASHLGVCRVSPAIGNCEAARLSLLQEAGLAGR